MIFAESFSRLTGSWTNNSTSYVTTQSGRSPQRLHTFSDGGLIVSLVRFNIRFQFGCKVEHHTRLRESKA